MAAGQGLEPRSPAPEADSLSSSRARCEQGAVRAIRLIAFV